MTKKQARILIGTLTAIAIIGAGLFTGWFFSTHKIVSVKEKAALAEKKAEPNFNTYDVSPPSRATILQTHNLALGRGGTNIFVPVPKNEAGDIKTGQRVLLYNAEGVALETLGVVSAVELGTDQPDSVTIVMGVQPDPQVDLIEARRASIVTGRIPAAARLPLTALVQNEKNESFVWEAIQNRDGTTTAYLQKISIATVTDDFFVIGEGAQRGVLYVLNPDDDLREGQKINTNYIAYQGPPQTEDSRIELLMEDRARERLAEQNVAGKQNAGDPAGTTMSTACNAPPTAIQDFIGKIKLDATAPVQDGPSSSAVR